MPKININIRIDDAEEFKDDLADLTCWWEGFDLGLKMAEGNEYSTPIAINGIKRVREVIVKIKEQIDLKNY